LCNLLDETCSLVTKDTFLDWLDLLSRFRLLYSTLLCCNSLGSWCISDWLNCLGGLNDWLWKNISWELINVDVYHQVNYMNFESCNMLITERATTQEQTSVTI